jgi:hypothetical protein
VRATGTEFGRNSNETSYNKRGELKMGFEFHVHGFWLLGAVFFFLGGIFAGNLRWLYGTTQFSYGLSVVLTFVFFLIAGMLWISASVNARQEERTMTYVKTQECALRAYTNLEEDMPRPKYRGRDEEKATYLAKTQY